MSQVVGFGFHAPSMPLVMVSPPLPLPNASSSSPGPALRCRRLPARGRQRRIAGAVRLAEGVAAGDQRHGLFVVHRHAAEGLAHIAARRHRVGVAIRAFRVHVDQAHLDGAERVGELPVAE
jgi:hypothetical protein